MFNSLLNYVFWILGVILVAGVVRSFVSTAVKARRIKKEGIETNAEIVRIEYTPSDSDFSESYDFHVVFRDEYGQSHEARCGVVDPRSLNKGDKIRIRYAPGQYDLVEQVR